jgi:uncharacterized membrane protein
MSRWNALAFAAAIGAVTGLRSMMGPAAVSQGASRKMLRLREPATEFLGTEMAANILSALAATELVADKMPFTPDRTLPPSLMLRAASGALCGAAVASAMRASAVHGAILGSAAAVGAAFAGREFRRMGQRQKWPAAPVALVEDVLAIGGAVAIISAI